MLFVTSHNDIVNFCYSCKLYVLLHLLSFIMCNGWANFSDNSIHNCVADAIIWISLLLLALDFE